MSTTLTSMSGSLWDGPGASEDKRRRKRKAAKAGVIAFGADGQPAAATIIDISILGCALKFDDPEQQFKGVVSIEIDGAAPMDALVSWCRSGTAGLQFMRPIDNDLVERCEA